MEIALHELLVRSIHIIYVVLVVAIAVVTNIIYSLAGFRLTII